MKLSSKSAARAYAAVFSLISRCLHLLIVREVVIVDWHVLVT